jgi:hypothetical protein
VSNTFLRFTMVSGHEDQSFILYFLSKATSNMVTQWYESYDNHAAECLKCSSFSLSLKVSYSFLILI